MPCDHDPGAAVLLQAPHRPEPRLGPTVVGLLVAPAEALYTHSLASAHRVARPSLVRRAGERGRYKPGRYKPGRYKPGGSPADPLAAGRGRRCGCLRDRGRRDHLCGGGRQAAACQPGREPAAARGEHLRGCGRRRSRPVGPAGNPGAGDVHHVHVAVEARTDAPVGVPSTTAPTAGTVPSTTAATTTSPSTRPPGGSDVGLMAFLERPAAASQHARTSKTQHYK